MRSLLRVMGVVLCGSVLAGPAVAAESVGGYVDDSQRRPRGIGEVAAGLVEAARADRPGEAAGVPGEDLVQQAH